MNIGIIGCGAVGQKRARHLAGARLAHCADTELARAAHVASFSPGCRYGTDWRDLMDRAAIDAVVIATPQDSQVAIMHAAVRRAVGIEDETRFAHWTARCDERRNDILGPVQSGDRHFGIGRRRAAARCRRRMTTRAAIEVESRTQSVGNRVDIFKHDRGGIEERQFGRA